MKRLGGTRNNGRQRGIATVEFGLIAALFFAVLLGIIEFGRFMYLWNTVQEVTRRAAREATVHWVDNASAVSKLAVFGGSSLPGAGEITSLQVHIRYLTADANGNPGAEATASPDGAIGNIAACMTSGEEASCIRFVEASVCESGADGCTPVKYVPMMGLFNFLAIDIPLSTVVMPAESLGYKP